MTVSIFTRIIRFMLYYKSSGSKTNNKFLVIKQREIVETDETLLSAPNPRGKCNPSPFFQGGVYVCPVSCTDMTFHVTKAITRTHNGPKLVT